MTVIDKGQVTLEATDLAVYGQVWFDAADWTPGSVVVPIAVWKDLVGANPEEMTTLEVGDAEAFIDGRTAIRVPKVHEYPKVDQFWNLEAGSVQLDGRALDGALSTSIAAHKGDARRVVRGVFVDVEVGRLRWAAMDAYRLAVCDTNIPLDVPIGIVPTRLFKLWKQLWGTRKLVRGAQTFAFGGHAAMLQRDNWVMGARLLEGTYPNYRQFLPTDRYPNVLHTDCEDMLRAVKVLDTAVVSHVLPIRLDLNSDAPPRLTYTDDDVGEPSPTFRGHYQGETMTIPFNSRYLTDGLTAIGLGPLTIEVLDPLKPVVIRGAANPGLVFVLTPWRLANQ